jgi:cytochrome c oxidase cbb3-type subunit 4
MHYEDVSRFAQQGGSIYFALLFLGVLIYALWPRSKRRFQDAARIPLEEDDRP